MIGIQDIELQQLRFYQDVFGEDWREGRQEGEMRVLRRLLERTRGRPLP